MPLRYRTAVAASPAPARQSAAAIPSASRGEGVAESRAEGMSTMASTAATARPALNIRMSRRTRSDWRGRTSSARRGRPRFAHRDLAGEPASTEGSFGITGASGSPGGRGLDAAAASVSAGFVRASWASATPKSTPAASPSVTATSASTAFAIVTPAMKAPTAPRSAPAKRTKTTPRYGSRLESGGGTGRSGGLEVCISGQRD